MEMICSDELCTGCLACYNACHKGAISYKPNEEGFLHPVINNEQCVNCGKCINVCPVNNPIPLNKSIAIYSGWSKDEYIRLNSSSGGAFSEIARIILSKHGVVFGCAFDDDLVAEHRYIETFEDLSLLRGSKYVQSNIKNTFVEAEQFLKQDRLVLFSGTSCQIAGLKNFLHKEYDNLITLDFVCHGVPSPLIFEQYKDYLCKTENFSKLTNYNFRKKEPNWFYFGFCASGLDESSNMPKTYSRNHFTDPYFNGFMKNFYLRPNCHVCPYANIKRMSDFTIADWWGYKKNSKLDAHYSKLGVSLVMANTAKAAALVSQLNMELRMRTERDAKNCNPCFSSPFPQPQDRTEFWNFYRTHKFEEVVKTYLPPRKMNFRVRYHSRFCDNEFAMFLFRWAYRFIKLPSNIFKRIKNIFI